MSNRGLSKEQKSKIISNILTTTKEPHTLPELEKAASGAGVGKTSLNTQNFFLSFSPTKRQRYNFRIM